MAHTKAQGAANRIVNVIGKRRGVKVYAGQKVKSGNIIVRQVGNKFHPGVNTQQGKDFTIFAVAEGVVSFRNMTGRQAGRKRVDVITPVHEAPKAVKAAKKVSKTAKK